MRIAIFFFVFCCNLTTWAQSEVIKVPYSTGIAADGRFSLAEYSGAKPLVVSRNGSDSTSYFMAYDSTGLYILAAGQLESAMLFPELLVNTQYSQRSNWQAGTDWWFHVSATDCESNQSYGDYSNCQTVQNGWLGVPNMSPGPPTTDTLELYISFSKLSYTLNTRDTLSFAAVLANNFNTVTWPANANTNNPSTWAALVFLAPSSIALSENIRSTYAIYPNPAANTIHLAGLPDEPTSYQVLNPAGALILKGQVSPQGIDISRLKSGIYLLALPEAQTIPFQKL